MQQQVFDVALLIPGLPCNGDSLEGGSLGGSESAGLYMAKALSAYGQRVKVFCNTSDLSRDAVGVEYYPAHKWASYSRNSPHDVTIVQRMPEVFAQQTASKLNLLWQHDLASGRESQKLRSAMWNIDRVLVVSEFMRRQYVEVTGIPADNFVVTRNGIDLRAFDRVRNVERAAGRGRSVHDPLRLVYSARPERGLDVLLRDIMPRLLRVEPQFVLHVYGYHNPVEHMRDFYAQCRRLGAALGEGRVVWHDPLSKPELYREYVAHGGVYVYPTPSRVSPRFAEVSCITLMEVQAAGMPVVTSDRGALGETLGMGAGVLVSGDPWTEDYAERFCTEVLRYARDHTAYSYAATCGQRRAAELSWDGVAEQWIEVFDTLICGRNDNPLRLARHLWRQSDIMALQRMHGSLPEGDEKLRNAVTGLLQPFVELLNGPERYAAQYARIGATHNDVAFESAAGEPRYQLELDWMRAHSEIENVLDYGCGLGGYAAFLARDTGKSVLGVDVDPATVSIARRKSAEHGISGAHFLQSCVDQEGRLPGVADSDFDCAVLQEVLEHVPEPWTVLQAVERKVKVGGWVYITVPYGPWEYSSYHTYPWRCHIWGFDQHDLHDMLDGKQDLGISSFYYGDSGEMGEAMGWWIVTYRADHEPIGRIDLERKLRLQRPRPLLSVTMIAGGEKSGETMEWCLKSLVHVADQLVVVDCGMAPSARAACFQYPFTEVQPAGLRTLEAVVGPNPLEVGFEQARNVGLDRCTGDWVLWIDSDERLINPRIINKYLRENMYHGYGIRQHHFAVDTQFAPDMPVRLFRRRPVDDGTGRVMRFYGALHEHAELGLNGGPGPVVVLSDVHIAHVGYLVEDVRQQRFARNYALLKLDQERYPDRLLQKHFLMRDNMILVREALRANGGRVDAAVRAKCQEVVDLYRKHFLGKGAYSNSDSVQYYSEALGVLDEGIEFAYSLGAARDGEPRGADQVARYRYANVEEFKQDLLHKLSERVGQQENYWW